MMTRTERFESMGAFLGEKRRLMEKRDRHARRIEQHWEALKDKKVRGEMASNALHDALDMWKPTRVLSSLLSNGSLGTSLGLALGSGKGGWPKRAALFALGLVAPKLIKRMKGLSLDDILHEVGVSVDHVRDHFRARRQERSEAMDGERASSVP
jgi:hypothetical protein